MSEQEQINLGGNPNGNVERSGMLPWSYNNKMGQVGICRGEVGEVLLYNWDAVQECIDEKCPAHSMCGYVRKGRCTVQLQYLKSIGTIIFRNYEHLLTEPLLYRIGMHLTPLYKTLCRLKIQELGVKNIVNIDDKGIHRIHPVFKEIRETIKIIDMTWSKLGLNNMSFEAGGKELPVNGDGEYYEGLGERKKGNNMVRRRRSVK